MSPLAFTGSSESDTVYVLKGITMSSPPSQGCPLEVNIVSSKTSQAPAMSMTSAPLEMMKATLICPLDGGLRGRAVVTVAATLGDFANRITQSAEVSTRTPSRGTQIVLSRMTYSLQETCAA